MSYVSEFAEATVSMILFRPRLADSIYLDSIQQVIQVQLILLAHYTYRHPCNVCTGPGVSSDLVSRVGLGYYPLVGV